MAEESYNILLVEDDPDDITLFIESVEESRLSGSQLVTARTLSDALDQLENGDILFDIVVIDLILPDCRDRPLRTLQKLVMQAPTLPIIVMTALDMPNLGRKCLRAGADEFLGKDLLSPEVIETAILHTIERRRHVYLLQKLLARIKIDGTEDVFDRLNGRYPRKDVCDERVSGINSSIEANRNAIKGNRNLIIAVLLVLVVEFIAVVVRTEMLEKDRPGESARIEEVIPDQFWASETEPGE